MWHGYLLHSKFINLARNKMSKDIFIISIYIFCDQEIDFIDPYCNVIANVADKKVVSSVNVE